MYTSNYNLLFYIFLILPLSIMSLSIDPLWSRVPIRNTVIKNANYLGGEGCQVVRVLTISPLNSSILLMGTDVGGIYIYTGNNQWYPAMTGWNSRGSTGFVFDPYNDSHILGIGGNSNGYPNANGIHISYNQASSWKFVYAFNDPVVCLNGQAILFDPTSYNTEQKISLIAYFSNSEGLFRSIDGGINWVNINKYMINVCLSITSKGNLFAISNDYRSYGFYNCGINYTGITYNCTHTTDNYYTGLTIPQAKNDILDTIYVSNWAGILKSIDNGTTFQYITLTGTNGLPSNTPFMFLSISPMNRSLMSIYYVLGPYWNTTRLITNDYGQHWYPSMYNNTYAFMPYNQRSGTPVWDPFNSDVFYNSGGDWVTQSTDSGNTLNWYSNGYNAVMTGGSFQFNIQYPNILFLSFQDYAGAMTWDEGNTWTWMNVANQTWGGMVYGGYALTPNILWGGNAPSWTGPRILTISYDSGKTFQPILNSSNLPLLFMGGDISYSSPINNSIGFASNYYTMDQAKTWLPMINCLSVLTHDFNPNSKENPVLYGYNNNHNIVLSYNQGLEWITLFSISLGTINDIAYDYLSKQLYVVGNNILYSCSNITTSNKEWNCTDLTTILPMDQNNSTHIRSVTIDPMNPLIVYASNTKDVYLASNAVIRSTDGGKTWYNLILDTPLSFTPTSSLQGPHEVGWVRVHPITRYLWAAGECFGVWKAPPPPPSLIN